MPRQSEGVAELVARVKRRREWPNERRINARRHAGVSSRELAAVIGVTHASVINWEQGKSNPKNWVLEDTYFEVLHKLEQAVI